MSNTTQHNPISFLCQYHKDPYHIQRYQLKRASVSNENKEKKRTKKEASSPLNSNEHNGTISSEKERKFKKVAYIEAEEGRRVYISRVAISPRPTGRKLLGLSE